MGKFEYLMNLPKIIALCQTDKYRQTCSQVIALYFGGNMILILFHYLKCYFVSSEHQFEYEYMTVSVRHKSYITFTRL